MKTPIKHLIILLFFITLFAAKSSYAAYSVQELYKNCQFAIQYFDGVKSKSQSPVKAGFCLGYITGLVNTHDDIAVSLTKPPYEYEEVRKNYIFCLDKGVTVEQIAKMYVKYVKENPELLHSRASSEIIVMLIHKFPCHN